MALGLMTINTTLEKLLGQVKRGYFHSVGYAGNGEFLCWLGSSANYYLLDEIATPAVIRAVKLACPTNTSFSIHGETQQQKKERIDAMDDQELRKQEFISAWQVWELKGHNPMEKLKLYEATTKDGTLFTVGLLDYVTLEDYLHPSDEDYPSAEQAFAAVGRAIDSMYSNPDSAPDFSCDHDNETESPTGEMYCDDCGVRTRATPKDW